MNAAPNAGAVDKSKAQRAQEPANMMEGNGPVGGFAQAIAKAPSFNANQGSPNFGSPAAAPKNQQPQQNGLAFGPPGNTMRVQPPGAAPPPANLMNTNYDTARLVNNDAQRNLTPSGSSSNLKLSSGNLGPEMKALMGMSDTALVSVKVLKACLNELREEFVRMIEDQGRQRG